MLDHGQNRSDTRYKQLWQRPQTDKMVRQSPDTIEALEEILGSLRITEENTLNRSTEPATSETSEEMSTVLAEYHKIAQAVISKSMVLDLEQFDRDRTKFEDWWRGICLFLKSNRVIVTDNKITAILAQFRGGVAETYIQKKIDQIKEEGDIQNWEKFVKEVKTAFSDKSKAADAE